MGDSCAPNCRLEPEIGRLAGAGAGKQMAGSLNCSLANTAFSLSLSLWAHPSVRPFVWLRLHAPKFASCCVGSAANPTHNICQLTFAHSRAAAATVVQSLLHRASTTTTISLYPLARFSFQIKSSSSFTSSSSPPHLFLFLPLARITKVGPNLAQLGSILAIYFTASKRSQEKHLLR